MLFRSDVDGLISEWRRKTTDEMFEAFASSLGVKFRFLKALGAARVEQQTLANLHVNAPSDAWAFPMLNGAGKSVGIRLRFIDGEKRAVTGSRAGLFVAKSIIYTNAEPIYIAEGPTDAAAGLTIGLFTIGRPSCLGNESDVVETVKRLKCRRVIIVADADEPGQRGAEKLQQAMRVPSIVWTTPKKDLRASINAGMEREDVLGATRDLVWSNPK
mgnify:CR=1 FL=1